MKKLPFYTFLLAAVLTSCGRSGSEILTINLKNSDYSETIDAQGTVQAVNTTNLVAPRINVSGIRVAWLAEEGTAALKGDTICILAAPEIDNTIEMFKTDLEKMEAELKKIEADNQMQLSMLNAQVEINNSQMAISMLDSVQMRYAPVVKQRLISLELEKSGIEKSKLRKKLAAQKRIDNSEIMQMRSRINMQKNRIDTYENQRKSLKLVASRDGVVMHYESPMMQFMSSQGGGTLGGKIEEGSSVWPGMTVVQIPDMSEMQVQIDVPEIDFKKIKEGQKAVIDVDAVKNFRTTGKVKRKTLGNSSPGIQTKIKTYQVIVSIDSSHLKIKPGLSAMCRITVEEVKDTVVIPAGAIFTRDSLKIVYVEDGDKFIPVEVETGFTDGSKSIIIKGLEGNETIALIEPSHKLIAAKVGTKTDTLTNTPADTLNGKGALIKSSIIKSSLKNDH